MGSTSVRKVGEAEAGERLDKWLASWPDVGSRRRAREALDTGKVTVDGRRVGGEAGGQPLVLGQRVGVDWNRPGTGKARRSGERGLSEAGLHILLEDDDLIAVDKPVGLLTDTASDEQAKTRDSVRKRLNAYLAPFGREAAPAHRIDRDTSGVVLFAKTDDALVGLRRQFKRREPVRQYRAWLLGRLADDEGAWTDRVAWHSGKRVQQVLGERSPGAKEAKLRFRVARRFGAIATEIEIQLVTGKRNQIRVQAAHRGHPLLGEKLYAKGVQWGRAPFPPRQALHAERLVIEHPRSHRPVEILAPLPDDLAKLVRQLGEV